MRLGRLGVSWCAVAVALAICMHQRHFTVSLAHPQSFVLMLRHKCGMVMAGSAAWAAAETLRVGRQWVAGWVASDARGVPSVFRV